MNYRSFLPIVSSGTGYEAMQTLDQFVQSFDHLLQHMHSKILIVVGVNKTIALTKKFSDRVS